MRMCCCMELEVHFPKVFLITIVFDSVWNHIRLSSNQLFRRVSIIRVSKVFKSHLSIAPERYLILRNLEIVLFQDFSWTWVSIYVPLTLHDPSDRNMSWIFCHRFIVLVVCLLWLIGENRKVFVDLWGKILATITRDRNRRIKRTIISCRIQTFMDKETT